MPIQTPAKYIEKLSNNPDRIDKFYLYINYKNNYKNNSSTFKKDFVRTTNLNNLRNKGVKTCYGIRNPTHILVFSKGPEFNNKYYAPFVIFVCSATRWAIMEPSEYINYNDQGMHSTSSLRKDIKILTENYNIERIMRYSRGSFIYSSYPLYRYSNYKLVEWNIGIERNDILQLSAAIHWSI